MTIRNDIHQGRGGVSRALVLALGLVLAVLVGLMPARVAWAQELSKDAPAAAPAASELPAAAAPTQGSQNTKDDAQASGRLLDPEVEVVSHEKKNTVTTGQTTSQKQAVATAPEDGGKAIPEPETDRTKPEAPRAGEPGEERKAQAEEGRTEERSAGDDAADTVGAKPSATAGDHLPAVSRPDSDGDSKTPVVTEKVSSLPANSDSGEPVSSESVEAQINTAKMPLPAAKAPVIRRAPQTVTVTFDATQGKGVTSAGTAYGTISGQFQRGKDPSGSYPTTVSLTIPKSSYLTDDNGNGWTANGWTNDLGGTTAKLTAGKSMTVADLLTTLGLDASTTSLTLYPIWSEPTITINYSVDKPTFGSVSKDKDVVGLISKTTTSPDGKIGCTVTPRNGGAFFMWTVEGTKAAADYITSDATSPTLVPKLPAIQSYLTTNSQKEFSFVAQVDEAKLSVLYDPGTYDGKAVTNATVPANVSVTDADAQRGYLANEATWSGYEFQGWYLDATYATAASSIGGGDPTYSQMAAVQTPDASHNITLYAKWAPLMQSYTVEWWKYDYLGVKVGESPVYSVTRSGQVTTQAAPTANDINLVGIADTYKSKLVGYDYAAALSSLGPETLQKGVPVTFTLAYRERTGYKVSYDLQGGTGGLLINGSAIVDKDDQRWLATSIVPSGAVADQPKRVGYEFGGWYYVKGIAGTPKTTFPTYDYKTPSPTTNATYADLVGNDPDVPELRLYARWTELQVTIKYRPNNSLFGYVSNSGEGSATQKIYAVTSTDADLKGSTATANKGFKFTGWKRVGSEGLEDLPAGFTSGLDGVTIKPLKENVDGTDIYLSAVYEAQFEADQPEKPVAKTYTVYFNGNGPISGVDQVTGQVNDTNSQAMVEDIPAKLALNGFARRGYTFKGWNTVAAPTSVNPGRELQDGQYVTNLLGTDFEDGAELRYLYAQWTENKVKLTYEADSGGQISRYEEEVPVVTGSALGSKAKPDPGYKFVDWAIEDDGDTSSAKRAVKALATVGNGNNSATAHNVIADAKDQTLRLSKGPSGMWVAESYRAEFAPISYTVAYDANGGSGSMKSETFTYEVRQALAKNAFAREGYDFKGWKTSTGYSVAESYSDSKLTQTDGATITLFAQWEKQKEPETPGENPGTNDDSDLEPEPEPSDDSKEDDSRTVDVTPSDDSKGNDPTLNTEKTDEERPGEASDASEDTQEDQEDVPGTTDDSTSTLKPTDSVALKPTDSATRVQPKEVSMHQASTDSSSAMRHTTPGKEPGGNLPQTGDANRYEPVLYLLLTGILLLAWAMRSRCAAKSE